MPVVQVCNAIPRDGYRRDYLNSTVKVEAGRQHISRSVIIDCLGGLGVTVQQVSNIYRLEQPSVWFIQFRNEVDASDFARYNTELHHGDSVFEVSLLNKQVLSLRIHWIPNYIHPEYIRSLAGGWGKVINCAKDRDENFVSNVYHIDLEVTMDQKKEIPHLCQFPDGRRFLITWAGRKPLCLNCLDIGHFSRNCTEKRQQRRSAPPPTSHQSAGNTYAGAVSGHRPPGADTASTNVYDDTTVSEVDSEEESTERLTESFPPLTTTTTPVTTSVTGTVTQTSSATTTSSPHPEGETSMETTPLVLPSHPIVSSTPVSTSTSTTTSTSTSISTSSSKPTFSPVQSPGPRQRVCLTPAKSLNVGQMMSLFSNKSDSSPTCDTDFLLKSPEPLVIDQDRPSWDSEHEDTGEV